MPNFSLLMAAFLAALFTASPAYADASSCEKPPVLTAFKLDKDGLERQASFINLWWKSGRPANMSFEEAKAIRTKDISDIYTKAESERRSSYANASCLVVSTKKCASTSGEKHKCPMSITPPTNMQFVPSTLKAIDDDFDTVPTFNGTNVVYTVKKTGKGSNTAGFQAMAEFTPAYIDAMVASELAQIHGLLDPLFVVTLDATN